MLNIVAAVVGFHGSDDALFHWLSDAGGVIMSTPSKTPKKRKLQTLDTKYSINQWIHPIIV